MNIDTWMHIWHCFMNDMPRNDIMTKPHHIMTKSHHVMVKPHHIMVNPHHVITNDHIRKLWLSIVSNLCHPVTLIFFYFGRKVKSSMDTNLKKTIKLFTSIHGFCSQKDKNLSFDRADRGLVPMT